MAGEINLDKLLASMEPMLHEGEYVFCTVPASVAIDINDIVCFFREAEGNTIIVDKQFADKCGLTYNYVSSWITLNVHSSLEAVGLTAAFSKALADEGISCNVCAAYYHDHIFVAGEDSTKAMKVLQRLSDAAL